MDGYPVRQIGRHKHQAYTELHTNRLWLICLSFLDSYILEVPAFPLCGSLQTSSSEKQCGSRSPETLADYLFEVVSGRNRGTLAASCCESFIGVSTFDRLLYSGIK